MLPEEIIKKKRDGEALARDEIAAFIDGLTAGGVSEGQAAAFAMAVFFKGMNRDETIALTLAMRDSGRTLSWPDLDGPVLDKHSTGGIGDKVSLILAPLIAAIGGYVPMISGRGLGHTGGTLDKLDSIPGYKTKVALDRLKDVVRDAGCAIVGQTAELAPADGKLYAIRDVTATVDVPPVIVASILSKKLAAGLGSLVLDVKAGSGAFMPSIEDASSLARDLVDVAEGAGLPCRARVTDMNQCLGKAAGNALEVKEAIEFLTTTRRDQHLEAVTFGLAASLAVLGGLAATTEQAMLMLQRALDQGDAAERFQRMVSELGGPNDLLQKPDHHLAEAPVKRPAFMNAEGFVEKIDVRALGFAIIELGGGRTKPDDRIDYRVGLSDVLGIGDAVGRNQPFAMIHAANDAEADRILDRLRAAVAVNADPPPSTSSPLLAEIAKGG